MSSVIHAKLILQILDDEHIPDLSKESDKRQLEIYTSALAKIREAIERYIPIEIPYETVLTSIDVLNELSINLVPIATREIVEQFRIKEDVLPLVEKALASAGQARKLYERERKKAKKGEVQKEDLPKKYDVCVIKFRRLIVEIHEYMREE